MAKGNRGGARKGAGRKSKAEEQDLIERLSPLKDSAFKALKKGLEQNQNWAVKLFMEYNYGKAKEFKEIELTDVSRKIGYGDIDED